MPMPTPRHSTKNDPRKKVPITPNLEDERGIYKICRICERKFYYDEYAAQIRSSSKRPAASLQNIVDSSWRFKTLCGDKACKDERNRENREVSKRNLMGMLNKEMTCEVCGKKYTYWKSNNFHSKFYCTKACSNVDFSLETLARELHVPKEWFQSYLVELSEKISSGEIKVPKS